MAKKNETKLSAAFVKQLKSMGFNCKSEEDARKQLLAALEKEGIDGMEDESLQTLIDMVSGWRETEDLDEDDVDEEEDDAEEVDEDEQDAEDLADEVEEEDAAAAEEEDNSEDEEAEDADDEETDDEEDDAEDDEVEEQEVKKPAKKTTAKKSESKSEEPKKKASTATKKVSEKPAKRSKKLDPKNNADDRQALIDAFSKMFPTDTYLYAFVINGVSIKYIGKNSKRGVFLYDNITRHNDGTITGNLYLNTMTKETDKLDELGIDYQLCWTNAPFVKAVSIEEANEILSKVFDIITSFVNKVDKRLGDNRKKMEESLEKAGKKSEKPAAKKVKSAKPAPEPEVDDEEEDDEVEEQEVKKPAKKTVVKKSATKKTKK